MLVFGGSQGARSINLAAVEAFNGAGFHVLHAAGERDLPDLQSPGPHYDLRGYIDDFGQALLASDLVIARAGGSIFEIAAHGRPAVLIPYPYATADHQSANARFMEQAGAAIVIPDAELTPGRLAQEVGRLLADRGRLAAMARAAAAVAKPDAAARHRRRGAGGGAELASRPVSTADWSGRQLHFVGIGGAGMSGLALVAHALGARVTGSDRGESPYLERLRRVGIEPAIGHRAQNVPAGSAGRLLDRRAGRQSRARGRHGRPAAPRRPAGRRSPRCSRCIAVTGTHGKTTTTAMIVHALRGAGMDPGLRGRRRAAGHGRQRGLGDGGVDRGRGRRVRPLAAQALHPRSPC